MSELYFLVRKLGLSKEVVSLSLVVTEVSRGGGMSSVATNLEVLRGDYDVLRLVQFGVYSQQTMHEMSG